MSWIKSLRTKGLSLRITSYLMIAITVFITAFLIFTAYHTFKSFRQLSTATDIYIQMEDAASDLMRASDYLTEEVQRYTVMTEREHLNNYFIEANVSMRREKSLNALAAKVPDSVALDDLRAAMQGSVALMDREYYAMRLVLEAVGDPNIPLQLQDVKLTAEDAMLSAEEKIELARRMVHDDVYSQRKTGIEKDMSACIDELKQQTYGVQDSTEQKMGNRLSSMLILILMEAAVVFLMIALIRQLGINPVLRAVEHIKKNNPLPIVGANEFRYLAAAYNRMYSSFKESLEHLNYKASHDDLTGAYNRAGYDLIKDSLDLSTTAFILFDVDYFKVINDSYGHETGDLVLKKIVATLKRNFRSDDYICRISGDEFVVFMVHVSTASQDLIRGKVAAINRGLADLSDHLPAVSVSAGVSLCLADNNSVQMFREADTALYSVKKRNRGDVAFAQHDEQA